MEKIVLNNGLRVILNKQNTTKSACFGIWIKSGCAYETEETNGISHFIEHMVFKGTEKRSAFDISEEMDSIGGQLNAYTAKEYTCFYAKTLSEHVPKAFDILADMIVNPKFDEHDIELEKNVVLEEINMTEDTQDDKVAENLYKNVWKSHPLGRPILGNEKSLNSFTAKDLKNYMKNKYSPERTVISICGNFDRDKFLNIVHKYFDNLKKGIYSDLSVVPTEYKKSLFIEEDLDSEQTHICICFPGFSAFDKKRNDLNLLNVIAGGSTSSRLFRRIREELGLVYTIYSSSICYNSGGLFEVQTATSHELAQKTFNEIVNVLKDLKNGISEKEFLRAKEQLKSSVIMGLESTSAKAAFAGRSEILKNRIKTEDDILNNLNSLTLKDINNVANEIIDFNKMSISIIGSKIDTKIS